MQGTQNRQIANPSTELTQAKGPEMNDRDYLNDALSTCKYLTDSLNIAVREASHDQLHQEMMSILMETHQSAREFYNLMFQKGWYKLEAEEDQHLKQAHQQFSQYRSQFPYQ